MFGEKTAQRRLAKLLARLGYEGEVLGWDTGDAVILASGQALETKGLVVATPEYVLVIDERTSRAMAMPWRVITKTETRQDAWKTSFVMYTDDGGSITLRTGAPRPVQTLIADWVEAASTDRESALMASTAVDPSADDEGVDRLLRQEWESGRFDPLPSFKVKDHDLDRYVLPPGLVCSWQVCPACEAQLLIYDGIADCCNCRRIWCDAKVGPVLDERSGAPIGREERIPLTPTDYESGDWAKPIAYLRWPSRDGTPWPFPDGAYSPSTFQVDPSDWLDEPTREITFPENCSLGLVVVADRRGQSELIPWAKGACVEEWDAEMRQFQHYLSFDPSASPPDGSKARWWIAGKARGIVTIPAACDALLLIQSWDYAATGAPDADVSALERQPADAVQGLILGTSWKRTGTDPSSLLSAAAKLPGLEALFMSSRHLRGQDWGVLASLRQLEVLDVDESSMDDEGLSFVSDLAELQYLCLADTAVGDAGLPHLRGLSSTCRIVPNWRFSEQAWSAFR
jgi:hypothetical protein